MRFPVYCNFAVLYRRLRAGTERPARRRGKSLVRVCLSLGLSLAFQVQVQTPVHAQAPSLDALAIADVRIVIDTSGSMKKNDPENLRQPSLALLLQLLSEPSRAGVWTFDEQVNLLVKPDKASSDWKREAIQQSRRIGSSGLFTNIGAALDQAAFDRDLRLDPNALHDPSRPPELNPIDIILLTDGMVDIHQNPLRNQAERQRILEQTLPQLQASGYRVHTIALSDQADHEFLEQLALATDGVSAIAHNADGLMKAFLRLLDQATPAAQLPLTDNRFWVDDSIEEVTALVFRRPGSEATQLVRPDHTKLQYTESDTRRSSSEPPDVEWYRTEQYDLITVPRPMTGEWQILADMTPDSRVTIVSNLNLVVKPLPNQVFVGQELGLSLSLQAQGETVTEADFLSLLTIHGRLQREDDNQTAAEFWQRQLGDGELLSNGMFQTLVESIPAAGDYRLSVVVDGKTFQRQFNHYFQARPSAISPHLNDQPQAAQPAAVEPLTTQPRQTLPAWILYAVLGGGNLILSLLAFGAYRWVIGRGEEPDDNTQPDINSDEGEEEPPAINLFEGPIAPIEIGPDPQQRAEDSSDDLDVDKLLAEFEQSWSDNNATVDLDVQPR